MCENAKSEFGRGDAGEDGCTLRFLVPSMILNGARVRRREARESPENGENGLEEGVTRRTHMRGTFSRISFAHARHAALLSASSFTASVLCAAAAFFFLRLGLLEVELVLLTLAESAASDSASLLCFRL